MNETTGVFRHIYFFLNNWPIYTNKSYLFSIAESG